MKAKLEGGGCLKGTYEGGAYLTYVTGTHLTGTYEEDILQARAQIPEMPPAAVSPHAITRACTHTRTHTHVPY